MGAGSPIECVGQTMQYVISNLTNIGYVSATVSPSQGAQVISVTADSVIVEFTGITQGQFNYTISVTNVNGCTFQTGMSYIIKATPEVFAQDLTTCINADGTYSLVPANVMVNGATVPSNYIFQYQSAAGVFTSRFYSNRNSGK